MKHTLLIITALMLIVGCSESDAQRSRNIIVSDVIEYHDNEGIPKKIRVYDISRDKVALTYEEIKFYRNGQKKTETTYKDGEKDGKATEWYENGQKGLEGTYKDGELDGLETWWHENGQKKKEGTYKDGEKDGKWTGWHENGQKSAEGTFKDGEPDGLWTRWYENGQKSGEGTFKDGKLIESTEWDEDGNVTDHFIP